MSAYRQNRVVFQAACRTLRALGPEEYGVESRGRDKVQPHQRLHPVFLSMLSPPCSPHAALSTAAQRQPSVAANTAHFPRQVATAGGIQAVVSGMKAHANDPDVQLAACSALWMLCRSVDNQGKAGDAGGVEGASFPHLVSGRVFAFTCLRSVA